MHPIAPCSLSDLRELVGGRGRSISKVCASRDFGSNSIPTKDTPPERAVPEMTACVSSPAVQAANLKVSDGSIWRVRQAVGQYPFLALTGRLESTSACRSR